MRQIVVGFLFFSDSLISLCHLDHPSRRQNLDGACIQSVNLVIDEDPRTEITLSHAGEVFMAGQYRISLPYSDGTVPHLLSPSSIIRIQDSTPFSTPWDTLEADWMTAVLLRKYFPNAPLFSSYIVLQRMLSLLSVALITRQRLAGQSDGLFCVSCDTVWESSDSWNINE